MARMDPSIEGLKEPVAEFDDGLGGVVTAVEWSADGNQCFVGGIDNEIKVRMGDGLVVLSTGWQADLEVAINSALLGRFGI